MLLFSQAKPTLSFRKISEISDPSLFTQYLKSVTLWFSDEWGYIHDKNKDREQAVQDRLQYLTENKEATHLAFYGKQLVGAFRVGYKDFDEELVLSQQRSDRQNQLKTSEIWFLYVSPVFRGLGAGRQIVQEIKRLSKVEMKASLLFLETLKPGLNRLYQSEGGEFVCEHQIDLNPTDALRIAL